MNRICCFLLLALSAHAEDNGRGVQGEAEIGAGYLSDGDYRYGRYSGLTDEGVRPLLNIRLLSRPSWHSDQADYWWFEGANLGLPSRSIEAAAGRQGQREFQLRYREMPYYLIDNGRTPFHQTDSAQLTLPHDWVVTGDTTADMPALDGSLIDVDIHQNRKRLELDYRQALKPAWNVQVEYRHDDKEGQRALGGVIGSTGGNARAAVLPAPMDFQTDIIELGLNYSANRYSVGIGYYGSFFRNDVHSLSWPNPFGQQPQWAPGVGYPDGFGRIALEPDNSFHQLFLSATRVFTAATRANVDISYGWMLQDDDFLTYTVNPSLNTPEPLPRDSLEGRIDTALVNFRLTSQPLPRLNLIAAYRFDDRDNKTPRDLYSPVPSDAQHQAEPDESRLNRPYSLAEHSFNLDARFRAGKRVRLHTGYEYSDVERDFSEVDSSTEQTLKAGMRIKTLDNFSLSVDFARQDRDTEPYVGNRPLQQSHIPGSVEAEDYENHPLLRKYYLADRQRDRIQLRANLIPTAPLSLGLTAVYNRDDYQDSTFGLNRAEMVSFTLDAGYSPRDEIQVNAFYTRDRYNSKQSGRAFAAAPEQALDPARDWTQNSNDHFVTAGVGVDFTHVNRYFTWLRRLGMVRELEAGLEVTYSRSRGEIDVDSGPALQTQPLPDLYTRLTLYRLHARYQVSASAAMELAIEHERYRSDDFALDTDPASMTNVLSLGEQSANYSINWITLNYAFRF